MGFLILLLILAAFICPIMAGVWILRPLDLAAKRFRHLTRFTIIDFFGLIFLVQAPMALTHALIPRSEGPAFWTMMILGWLISAAVWYAAVKTFSNAGISNVWERAILVYFALPVAYFVTFAIVIIPVAVHTASNMSLNAIVAWWFVDFCLMGLVVVAGIVTRRIAPIGWNFNGETPFLADGEKPMIEASWSRDEPTVDHLYDDPSLSDL